MSTYIDKKVYLRLRRRYIINSAPQAHREKSERLRRAVFISYHCFENGFITKSYSENLTDAVFIPVKSAVLCKGV